MNWQVDDNALRSPAVDRCTHVIHMGDDLH